MPKRSRSHILEDESINRFRGALPPGWVYRIKTPDYGIDGEVEIFDDNGSSTGLSFNVQLRATDDIRKADRVRLEIDELNYYASLDTPTAVVRYCSDQRTLFWQWASNIVPGVDFPRVQKTFTYAYKNDERWTEYSSLAIRRVLELRRGLANFPPSTPVPLRVDLCSLPVLDRYSTNRAISRAIAESGGALVLAKSAQGKVEAFARLTPDFLAVGFDVLTGVTFDLPQATADEYVTSMLYGLVRLFWRHRLIGQAEALALVLSERGQAHHSEELAMDACAALSRHLSALVQLAIVNGLQKHGPLNALIAMTIASSPQPPEIRRAAMDDFFDATLASTDGSEPSSEAAAHYSIGNFYRNQCDTIRAIHHYNRARHLRPAYFQASYFNSELAGVLFVAGRYAMGQRLYGEAVRLVPDDNDLVFLYGDALLLSGAVAEARSRYAETHSRLGATSLKRECEMKLVLCDFLITSSGSDTLPRRRSEASRALRGDGRDAAEHLQSVLLTVDSFHPLARFNLGILLAGEGDPIAACNHFLCCACIQPSDVEAWVNAGICSINLDDEVLLLNILSTAINYNGSAFYDRFRSQVLAQGISTEKIEFFDEKAMQFLADTESRGSGGYTVRMLDGESYQVLTILAPGESE